MKPADQPRVAALDGLRGLAIAAVLWHHLVESYLPLGPSSPLGYLRAAFALSWTGVDLFFVLSGYLIGGILLDHRASPNLARTFYARRAARILPLYFVTLAVILMLVAARLPGSSQLFPGWVYGLFLSNIAFAVANQWDWFPLSVLWSIAVEEQFYLTGPWIARWIAPVRVPLFLLGLVAVAWLWRSLFFWFEPDAFLARHVLMPARMDTLAFGVLVAWTMRHPGAAAFLARLRQTWLLWLAGAGALYAMVTVNLYLHVEYVRVCYGYTLVAAIYAFVLLVVVAVQPPVLTRLLASPVPVSVGRHSYFIYLWHMLIGAGVLSLLGGASFQLDSLPSLGVVLLAIGSTWLAAVVSWKFFEAPLVRLGHRVAY